jgi:signal transduction histidine kinase
MTLSPPHRAEVVTRLLAAITPLLADATRAELNVAQVLRIVCRHAQDVSGAAGAVVEMAEDDVMVYVQAAGTLEPYLGLRLKRDGSLSGLCLTGNETAICSDSELDPRVDREACRMVGARSLLVVPLRHGDTAEGVLKVVSGEPEAFDADAVAALEVLGSIVTVIILRARDIALRAEMNESLELNRRISSLGHLVKTITHQFNNVLMAIQTSASHLARLLPPDAKLEVPIRAIHEAVRRGKEISGQVTVLRASKGPAGATRLGPFFEQLRPRLAVLAGLKVGLAFDVDEGLMVALNDSELAHVVTTLVQNAIDAMPGGGTLTIEARLDYEMGGNDAKRVRISVTDTGSGMDENTRAHMFDPMFTTKHGRTGLGLSIAYQIVGAHGGTMTAKSQPAAGTTLHVYLPAQSPTQPGAASPRVEVRYVVLVEDEEPVGRAMESLLTLSGIRCTWLKTGEDAVRLLERETPDALVLDVALPGISGTEVFEIVRRRVKVPVIFSTGHGTETALRTYLAEPGVSLLRKPYEFEELLALLRTT